MRRGMLIRSYSLATALAGAWLTYMQNQPAPPIGILDIAIPGLGPSIGGMVHSDACKDEISKVDAMISESNQ
jgi:hypothetical protein